MFAGLEPRLPSCGRPLHAFHCTKFFMLKPVFKKVWLQRNMDLIKQLSYPNNLMLEKQTAKYELCAKHIPSWSMFLSLPLEFMIALEIHFFIEHFFIEHII